MIIDILKERFETDSTRVAMVRAWGCEIKSVLKLSIELEKIVVDELSGLQVANVDSVERLHRLPVGRKAPLTPNTMLNYDFNESILGMRFSMKEVAPKRNGVDGRKELHRHRVSYSRYSDRIRTALDRKEGQIRSRLDWILRDAFRVSVSANFNSSVVTEFLPNGLDELKNLFPNIDYAHRLDAMSSKTKQKQVRDKLRAKVEEQYEPSSEYCARKDAVDLLGFQMAEIQNEIGQLERKAKEIQHTANKLVKRNREKRDADAEKLLDREGYFHRWYNLQEKLSKYKTELEFELEERKED